MAISLVQYLEYKRSSKWPNPAIKFAILLSLKAVAINSLLSMPKLTPLQSIFKLKL